MTINLPDVALSSGGNIEKFWKIFDERLELCHRALRCRHERLKGTTSDAAPILWQYGALARLKKGEVIDKLLYGGYSTISLLRRSLRVRQVHDRQEPHRPLRHPLALSIMQRMNDKCKEWKNAEDIRLLPLRHAAGVHHLQVRQVPAKSASASSRASPTRATSPTATTSTSPNPSTPSPSWSSRPSSSTCPPAAPSAMWRCRICRTTSPPCWRS